MKALVVGLLQQRERRTIGTFTIGVLAVVFVGLAGLVACNDKDTDERQRGVSKVVPGQQTAAQKSAEKPDVDEGEEGEEGPATPVTVAAEKPASQQASGQRLIYNFDSDSVGQIPAKFHAARTGQGSESMWAVMAD